MKTKFLSIFFTLTLLVGATSLFAQGTAFTYQGRLNDGVNPANGNYDLRFSIYDLNTGGAIVGGSITNSPTAVSNGLFTVTLDFGAGIFSGADRWLQIAMRTNGVGSFIILNPRQAFTATPYAMQATSASNFTGTIADLQLSANIARLNSNQTFTGAVTLNNPADVFTGTHNGNGSGLTGLTGSNVVGAVSEALHATDAMTATNAPDGNTIVSKNGATNIVTTINSNNVLNVLDFGVVPGQTNQAEFQRAIGTAGVLHSELQVPKGEYYFTDSLYVTNSNFSMVGLAYGGNGDWGPAGVVFHFPKGTDGLIVTNVSSGSSPNNISIENIVVLGANNESVNNVGIKAFGYAGGGSIDFLNLEKITINGFKTNCWWQEVSNSKINFCDFSNPATNGCGLVLSGYCNGDFIEATVTSDPGQNATGARLQSRGTTVILHDMGGPGMTSCLQLDDFTGSIIGGNLEWYGGDIAAIKTISGGNACSIIGTSVRNSSGSDSSFSFAFDDDGTYGSTIYLEQVGFQQVTNIGGVPCIVKIKTAPKQKIFSDRLLRTAIYSGSILLFSNAVTTLFGSSQYGAVGPEITRMEDWVDYSTYPPTVFRRMATNAVGDLFDFDYFKYYKDVLSGLSPQTSALTRWDGAQIFNKPITNYSETHLSQTVVAGNLIASGTVTATNFSGSALGLTNLTATNLVGTIADAQLSTNVALLNTSQVFSADKVFTNGAQLFIDPGSAAAPSLAFNNDVDTGLFRPSTNSIGFAIAGAEKIRINSVGKLGIGTNSPSVPLDVIGAAKVSGNVTIGAFPIISVSTNIPVTGDTLFPATGFVKLSPTSAVTLSLTTAISDGSVPGQLLILEGQPSGGGFTFITNNANTHLSANGHTLNVNDTLVLIWDGNNWVELSFANN
jgi:hypothetical protein